MEYQIIRSRRKTISIQILPDGQLLVRCPSRMPARAVADFVESKRDWIEKHMPPRDAVIQPKFSEAELGSLAQQAGQDLPERVARFAPRVGVSVGRITIRAQRTRWGSCSGKGNLNFNCLLMLLPEEVRDYVVIHELCHRKHMNHSREFWEEVERILPGYRQPRKTLKEEGGRLIARLP